MNLPPFQTFPELSSERILLRELKQADIPFLLEILTYDGKVAETLEDGIRISERIHQDYLDGSSVNWVIEELSTNEPIGFIGYYRGFEYEVGELGFILKAEFRGLGFMSSSLQLVTEFGLNQIKIKQIIALTKPENANAIAVLNRNGFLCQEALVKGYLKFAYSVK